MEKEDDISEGQVGLRRSRSCVDHVYTVGRISRGRKEAGLTTYYCFFLDAQKAYDIVRRNGAWKMLWEIPGTGQRKNVENDAKGDGMCDKCCVMLDG